MTFYYLELDDRSGIFSTKEKALEHFYEVAEKCDWKNIEVINRTQDWIKLYFDLLDEDNDTYTSLGQIIAYELDRKY